MALPEITHLQWLVLGALLDSDEGGYRIREELAKHRVKKSGPAFYQLMARLEADGLVKGWYEHKMIGAQPIKERWYKLTGAGRRAWKATTDFYVQQSIELSGARGLANA